MKKKKIITKNSVIKKESASTSSAKKEPSKSVAKSPKRQILQGYKLTADENKLLSYHQSLVLQIELVPSSCWWSNVRSNITQKQWDNIRKQIYQKANFVCEICGEKGIKHPVECHEVWIYDDISLIQRLGYFQGLCPLCHEVKHIGSAAIRGYGRRAFERFKTINQLDDNLAIQVKNVVSKQWKIRSSQQWKLDIEHLQEWGINLEELKERH